MQALELERFAPGHPMDRRNGVRVVGGEHRVEGVGRGQHALGAGQVADVGIGFAGKHRIAGIALYLGTFDFAVPVSTLDQAHRHTPTHFTRRLGEIIECIRGTFLIGLNGQSVAFPAIQRAVAIGADDHVQTELKAIGFLGIDGKTDALDAGQLGQFQHPRGQLGMCPGALADFVARVQRR